MFCEYRLERYMQPVASSSASNNSWFNRCISAAVCVAGDAFKHLQRAMECVDVLFEEDYLADERDSERMLRWEATHAAISSDEELELLQGYDFSDMQHMVVMGDVTVARLCNLRGLAGAVELTLRDCAGGAASSLGSLALRMPNLRKLSLERPKVMPNHIQAFGRLSELSIQGYSGAFDIGALPLENLTTLRLRSVQHLGRLELKCPQLKKLEVVKCQRLISIHGLHYSRKLREITIDRCPVSRLSTKIGTLKCLERLFLNGLPNLHCLPETIEQLPLRSIEIGNKGPGSNHLITRILELAEAGRIEAQAFVIDGRRIGTLSPITAALDTAALPRGAKCLPPALSDWLEELPIDSPVRSFIRSIVVQLQAYASTRSIRNVMDIIARHQAGQPIIEQHSATVILNYSEAIMAVLRLITDLDGGAHGAIRQQLESSFETADSSGLLFARPADIARRTWIAQNWRTGNDILDQLIYNAPLPFSDSVSPTEYDSLD